MPENLSTPDSPWIRIRRAELAMATARLEYLDWFAREVAQAAGSGSQPVRQAIMDIAIARAGVDIAEAQLELAIADESSPALPRP